MTDEQIMKNELEAIKRDLIAKHSELGMRSSGQWAESVEVVMDGLHGEILGNDYTYQLQHGRKPGKFPPIADIEEWILAKGIPVKDIKVSSLAFLIARKISEKGTKYFQDGGTDLVDSVVTVERIQSIIDKVSKFHIGEFQSQVIEQFLILKVA